MSSPNYNHPQYVSIDEAAKILSVSTRTIRNWIESGGLPAIEAGPKLLRIDVLDLRAFCRPTLAAKSGASRPSRSSMTRSAREAKALRATASQEQISPSDERGGLK